MYYDSQWLSFFERSKTCDIEFVIFLDFCVVFFVGKGQRKHSLFFEVGFVDSRKGFYEDGTYA